MYVICLQLNTNVCMLYSRLSAVKVGANRRSSAVKVCANRRSSAVKVGANIRSSVVKVGANRQWLN